MVLGVVLVLGSVLLGAVVVSRAQASTAVWSLRRDLPAGSVLAADDLVPVSGRRTDAAGERWRITFTGAGTAGRVEVEVRLGHVGQAQRLTCGAGQEQYARTWELVGLTTT